MTQSTEVAVALNLPHQAVITELHLGEGLVDQLQELPDVIVEWVGLSPLEREYMRGDILVNYAAQQHLPVCVQYDVAAL